MDIKRVIILCASGFIGQALYRRFGREGVVAAYYSRPVEDGFYFNARETRLADVIADPERISHAIILLGDTKPESCAADPIRSKELNVEGIKRILDQLREWSITPIFASTEVVFDGTRGGYTEDDPVSPTLVYARQKVEIEEYIADGFENYLIARLALVYGTTPEDGTLLTSWAAAINRGQPLACAYDYFSSPIHVDDVAEAIQALIRADRRGIYHLAGPKAYSRCQLLDLLLAETQQRGLDLPPVRRCSINDFEVTEPRPLDVSLKNGKLVHDTGFRPRELASACREVADRVFSPLTAIM
ncbi:MAG: sugar nucleotide-binding protein [Deltaproteobacteria bacterium]|nr:sugar nucleotide-binding protein [Deltaproteobacteria bacterium]